MTWTDKIFVEALGKEDPCPEVGNLLATFPKEALHHRRLRLRHPKGIYFLSLARLAERFEPLLDSMEERLTEFEVLRPRLEPNADGTVKNNGELEALLEKTLDSTEGVESLVYSIAEHLEDCRNILLSLFPSNGQAKKHPSVRGFKRHIETYRNRVGEVVNAVKHRGARIQSLVMYDAQKFVPGYFVEGPLELPGGEDVVGPDPNLHDAGDTAFSLFRDLKWHFVSVYQVAAFLREAVLDIVQTESIRLSPNSAKLESKSPNRSEEPQRPFLDLARRLSLLPDVVFPDETSLPYPLIRIAWSDAAGCRLVLSCSESSERPRSFRVFQQRVRLTGDSSTRIFKIPYLSKDWQRRLKRDS